MQKNSIHWAKIARWLLLRLRCPSFAGSRVSPFADNKRPERRQPGLLCQEANIRWLRRCRSLFAQQELLMFFFFLPHVPRRYAQLTFFQSQLAQGFFRSFVLRTFGKTCSGASWGASAGASDYSAMLYMIRWKFLQSICRFLVSFIARLLDRLLCRFLFRFFLKIDVLGCDQSSVGTRQQAVAAKYHISFCRASTSSTLKTISITLLVVRCWDWIINGAKWFTGAANDSASTSHESQVTWCFHNLALKKPAKWS